MFCEFDLKEIRECSEERFISMDIIHKKELLEEVIRICDYKGKFKISLFHSKNDIDVLKRNLIELGVYFEIVELQFHDSYLYLKGITNKISKKNKNIKPIWFNPEKLVL